MKSKTIIYTFLSLTLLTSCVKEYDFDPESYEKFLVVDGAISDQPGPYEVKLTYTYPLDTVLSEVVDDAEIWVETSDGARIDFTWSEEGAYMSPADFQGALGKEYQLFINMSNGESYLSSVEKLIASPPIDSIYQRFIELPTEEGDRNVGGIQFFIDSHDDSGQAKYFRYEWEEAYKIQVPYPAKYEVFPDTTILPLEEEIGICYQENSSYQLIFGTSSQSSANRMAEFPVRFVSQEEQTLQVRYTILVKQFAISEAAYLYYKRLRENNESGGSFFDQQQGSVFGNISSADDPNEPVLGYFEAAGESQLRRFFSVDDLDEEANLGAYSYNCLPIDIVNTTLDSAVLFLGQSNSNVFSYNPLPFPRVFIHTQACTDCSYYADLIPPEYWIE